MLRASLRPRRCPVCQIKFLPERLGQKTHPECVEAYIQSLKEKAWEKAKSQEKREDRAKRERLKTLSQLTEECRRIVQKIARIRDRHDGCISCHIGPNYGGIWHGSHYRPAGNNAAVELHLWNIHKACEQCNYFKGGNLGSFRPRLIEKIGAERVEWLESQTQMVKRPREYLERFKKVMGKRARRMERKA